MHSCHVQLTACKVDHIEKFAKDQLAKGHCIVIGLQSTGARRRCIPLQLQVYILINQSFSGAG